MTVLSLTYCWLVFWSHPCPNECSNVCSTKFNPSLPARKTRDDSNEWVEADSSESRRRGSRTRNSDRTRTRPLLTTPRSLTHVSVSVRTVGDDQRVNDCKVVDFVRYIEPGPCLPPPRYLNGPFSPSVSLPIP